MINQSIDLFGKRIDTKHPFYLGGIEIPINGKTIRFFSNWFHYLPWDNEPEKMGKTVEELLEWEQSGARFEMLKKSTCLRKCSTFCDTCPVRGV